MNSFLIWLLAAFAAPPAATAPASQMSASEAAAVHQAAERGTLIYAYDQAAWHGTDDLAAKMPDFQTRVGGWIVDGPAEAPEIVFFDKNEADPQALYVADFHDNRLVSSKMFGPADDRTLSPARKALIAALGTARHALVQSDFRPCKPQPFNSVMLPPAKVGNPTLVYFLTPQTVTQSVPFGGHYLFEIGPDGKVHGQRRFTNSCLEMPLKPQEKGQTAALFITHLLDPTPTEIHVFSSLAAHVPVVVGTVSNRHLWAVAGAHIELMSADLTEQ